MLAERTACPSVQVKESSWVDTVHGEDATAGEGRRPGFPAAYRYPVQSGRDPVVDHIRPGRVRMVVILTSVGGKGAAAGDDDGLT